MKIKIVKKMVMIIILLISVSTAGYIANNKLHLHLERHFMRLDASKAKVSTVAEPVTFKQVESALQVCYDELITRSPDRDEGQVLYHMMFSVDGEISHLEIVSSDFNDDKFHSCLTDTIKGQRVQTSPDRVGVLIAHHFKFHRKDQSKLVFDE